MRGRRGIRISWPALAPWIAGLIGLTATLYLFYPGFMEWDAVWQLQQAVTGNVNNAHPPIMVYLWSLVNRVTFGPGGMLALHAAVTWGGLALIATGLARTAPARAALVLGPGLFPPVLGLLGTVSKDTGALAALVATCGLVLHARRRRRRGPALAALPFAFYALAVRFNNVLTLLPLLWLLAGALQGGRLRRAVAFPALLAAMTAAASLVNTLGVERMAYFTAVPLWDLSQISLETGEMLVPRAALRRPDLDLARLRWISRPYRCDYRRVRVAGRPTQDIEWSHLTAGESRAILRDWGAAILAHPGAYGAHRNRVMRALLFAPDPVFPHEIEQIEGFPLDIEFTSRPGYAALARLLDACAGSFLCAPATYLLLAALVWGASWRDRSGRGSFARAVAASGLLSVVPLYVLAPSIDFRYSAWLVVASLVSALALGQCALRSARR